MQKKKSPKSKDEYCINMFSSNQKTNVEEYYISTSSSSIDISSPSEIGAMHAIVTLKQLFSLSLKK